MFKRKYPALLLTADGAQYGDYRRTTYTIEGPKRLRLAEFAGNDVLLLRDDGTVGGSVRFTRWEALS